MSLTTATRRATRSASTQVRSLDAFLATKARMDALLARLGDASENHFGADPEAHLWGAAASLARVEELLREAADFIQA